MPSIIANCHGGFVHGMPTFQVPVGITVHFYTADSTLLGNIEAWAALQHLLQLLPGQAPHHFQSFAAGAQCPDYYGVPYNGLGVVNGVLLERTGRRQSPYFDKIIEGGGGQNWGPSAPNTIQSHFENLPAVGGGAAYMRSVIQLSNIANCPGITDVHWLSCREAW